MMTSTDEELPPAARMHKNWVESLMRAGIETMCMEHLKLDPNILTPHSLEDVTRKLIRCTMVVSPDLWTLWARGVEELADYRRATDAGTFKPPTHLQPSLALAAEELLAEVKASHLKLRSAVELSTGPTESQVDAEQTADSEILVADASKAEEDRPAEEAKKRSLDDATHVAAELEAALSAAKTLLAHAQPSESLVPCIEVLGRSSPHAKVMEELLLLRSAFVAAECIAEVAVADSVVESASAAVLDWDARVALATHAGHPSETQASEAPASPVCEADAGALASAEQAFPPLPETEQQSAATVTETGE